MAERMTVRLPAELLRRAKRKAAAEGRSLTALIEDGLRWGCERAPPCRQDPAAREHGDWRLDAGN